MLKRKLFIIGNGFDLSHDLPTDFYKDFRIIAENNESLSYFWDLYQTQESSIWSDFENLLGKPNFDSISEIFVGYSPDYLSDKESDRDNIFHQVELNGKLYESLQEFSFRADEEVNKVEPIIKFLDLFEPTNFFLSFNYTHTLEKVYNIDCSKVLHIHGEMGVDDLVLGFPKGNFSPEDFQVDVRMKGRGPYRYDKYDDYISGIEDYYIKSAYEELVRKTSSFSKEVYIDLLDEFCEGLTFDEIHVLGHSIAIDFPYFRWINLKYPDALWLFEAYDDSTRNNIEDLIEDIKINNFRYIDKEKEPSR